MKASPHLPSLAIFASTFIWGTWWIPLRKLDSLGNGTIWLTAMGVALPALFLLPYALRHHRRIMAGGLPLLVCGVAFGLTNTLYAEGAMRGNVARVILLFYLTPVWSTLLAWWMLKQPITARRLLTILLGLAGMWIILGGEAEALIPTPRDAAEWMGLGAGMFWAITVVYVQITGKQRILDVAFPCFLMFSVFFILVTLIPGGRSWGTPPAAAFPVALVWVVLIAVIWHMPAILLTLYGATSVEPGRVAILLMMEVVVGVGSAALLLDQPFGLREILGTVFVMSASVCEFVPWPWLERLNRKST